MDGDKSSIMVMEPPSPQCVGEWHLLFSVAIFGQKNLQTYECRCSLICSYNEAIQEVFFFTALIIWASAFGCTISQVHTMEWI